MSKLQIETPINDVQDNEVDKPIVITTEEATHAFLRLVKTGQSRALRKLLRSRNDINVNMHKGLPLLYAIKNELNPVVDVLLNHPDIDVNVSFAKPLIFAIEYDNYDAFKKLLENGANVNYNPYVILQAVKYNNDGRYKRQLIKYGFTYFNANIPSYIRSL